MIAVIFIVLIASACLGYRVISAVPPLLHTPLMSGMNALSGIIVLGAISVFAAAPSGTGGWAAAALVLAVINVVGGFWVTERMLRMFNDKKREKEATKVPWRRQ